MTTLPRLGSFLSAMLLSVAAAAETVYVTDQLQLGLYEQQGGAGRPFRVLASGTALDIVERVPNFARVRAQDGAEGWVKSAFLVTEEPARARLSELEGQNSQLSQQLESARDSLSTATSRIADLEATVSSADERISGLSSLEDENQTLRGKLERYRTSVTLPWLLAAAVGSLILGFVGGATWLDRRVRKRFGGVRIY